MDAPHPRTNLFYKSRMLCAGVGMVCAVPCVRTCVRGTPVCTKPVAPTGVLRAGVRAKVGHVVYIYCTVHEDTPNPPRIVMITAEM